MRILLAEDDRMLNRALCYQLENLDFQVDSCLDGEDALFYGEQNIYDVILLDRMLPGMEGTEILTALRAKGISTPIIMINDYCTWNLIGQGKRTGSGGRRLSGEALRL